MSSLRLSMNKQKFETRPQKAEQKSGLKLLIIVPCSNLYNLATEYLSVISNIRKKYVRSKFAIFLLSTIPEHILLNLSLLKAFEQALILLFF